MIILPSDTKNFITPLTRIDLSLTATNQILYTINRYVTSLLIGRNGEWTGAGLTVSGGATTSVSHIALSTQIAQWTCRAVLAVLEQKRSL